MTKKNLAMLENYKRATATSLHELYKSYSHAKAVAYNDCISRCVEKNGFRVRVFSANTYGFCFAFLFEKEGKQFLHYETSQSIYEFALEGCVYSEREGRWI